jgi:hypothetical protein
MRTKYFMTGLGRRKASLKERTKRWLDHKCEVLMRKLRVLILAAQR